MSHNLDGHRADPVFAIASLLAAEGRLRVRELEALRWSDLELEGGHVRVSSKSGSRLVPISPYLSAALREWKVRPAPTGEGSEAVLTNRHGRPLSAGLIASVLGQQIHAARMRVARQTAAHRGGDPRGPWFAAYYRRRPGR